MAVVVGLEGRPAPLLEEFAVADSERETVDGLVKCLAGALDVSDAPRPALILAALAELGTRYMRKGSGAPRSGRGRAAP